MSIVFVDTKLNPAAVQYPNSFALLLSSLPELNIDIGCVTSIISITSHIKAIKCNLYIIGFHFNTRFGIILVLTRYKLNVVTTSKDTNTK